MLNLQGINERLESLEIKGINRDNVMDSIVSITTGLTTKNGIELNYEEALEVIKTASALVLGFASIFNVSGVYTHEDGHVISEKSIRIETCINVNDYIETRAKFEKLAVFLQRELEQESILYSENIQGRPLSYFIKETA